jgi:hypothetical protein
MRLNASGGSPQDSECPGPRLNSGKHCPTAIAAERPLGPRSPQCWVTARLRSGRSGEWFKTAVAKSAARRRSGSLGQQQGSRPGSHGTLPSALASRRGLPSHGGIEPDRQRAPALQRFVVARPVPGLVERWCPSARPAQLPRWIHEIYPLEGFMQKSPSQLKSLIYCVSGKLHGARAHMSRAMVGPPQNTKKSALVRVRPVARVAKCTFAAAPVPSRSK